MDVKAEKKSQIQGIEATVRKKYEIGLCCLHPWMRGLLEKREKIL